MDTTTITIPTTVTHRGRPNPQIFCACGCGRLLLQFDGSGRARRYLPGHNAKRRR